MKVTITKDRLLKVRGAVKTHGLIITSALFSSLLVSCASVDRVGQAASVEQTGSVQLESAQLSQNAPIATVAKTDANTNKTVAAKAKASEENADALMATLVAPLEEPATNAKAQVKVVEKTRERVPPKKLRAAKVEKTKASVPVAKKAEPVVREKVASVVKVEAKPVVVTQKRNSKPLNASLDDLPINYDIWKIKRGEAQLDKGIVISTPTWEMGKEGYMSQIWVTIMDDKVLVNSSSDIDDSTDGLGVRINNGELIPFSRIEDHNIGVLDGDWLETLAKGGKMDIYMGFFPDREPKSETFKSDLALDSLSRVVPTYKALVK